MMMAYHSELHCLLQQIDQVQRSLEAIVVSGERQFIHHHLHCEWLELLSSLDESLESLVMSDESVKRSIYNRHLRKMKGNVRSEHDNKVPDDPDSPQPLNHNQQKALKFIRSNGPVRGKDIAKHVHVGYSTFKTHYVKKLRTHGVESGPEGYFIPGDPN